MANVTIPNFLPESISTNVDVWTIPWKLSRALKAAGWTYKSSSNGTSKDTSGTASNDYWGGNANPLNDTYPSFPGGNTAAQAWWNAQGPSTLKIPITVGQTQGTFGGFIRGEVISQAVTGAKGEIIGYIYDYNAVQGFLVVMPRVDGSGADPHGWDHTHVITGTASGATVTPSATIIEFVREIVLWKDTTLTNQTVYVQCVDQSAENSSRFSVLATSAGCTGSVAPGGGGTSNAFPTLGSYTAGGTGGSQSASPIGLFTVINSTTLAHCQIIAANASYNSTTSADGTFIFTISSSNFTFPNQPVTIQGYFRTDFQEDGDVDPYVYLVQSGDANSYTVTASAKLSTNLTGGNANSFTSNWNAPSSGSNFFRMWRRRGFSSNDAFTNGIIATHMTYGGTTINSSQVQQMASIGGVWDRDRQQTAITDTYVGDYVWAVSSNTSNKIRKGALRWLRIMSGSAGDTYGFNGSRTWISIGSLQDSTGNYQGAIIIGPWDGVTSPTSQ
jgi:hypothetical protein